MGIESKVSSETLLSISLGGAIAIFVLLVLGLPLDPGPVLPTALSKSMTLRVPNT